MLTDAQIADVRRYCGYPTTAVTVRGSDAMDIALANITAAQINIVTMVYLNPLRTSETALLAMQSNLDTDRAAVWVHNKQELADRQAQFYDACYRLASFLGVPPGPNFVGFGGGVVPAAFVV
jgi:hypothetical protein